jgi:PhoPQ-activated pathogenicity-related protein
MTISGRVLIILLVSPACANASVLDDYVAEKDPVYAWQVSARHALDNYFTKAYTLDLTSQQWRDASELDSHQVLWRHWVNVVVPQWDGFLGAKKDTALILINGGDRSDPMPPLDPRFRQLAAATRSIIVELTAVPNQPILFSDESAARNEDEIIAYSWDKFLSSEDPNWPLQLPMVKSVIACMDAVQEFAQDQSGHSIKHFVLTGGSKRGWTAMLTAAVDERVTAIAPIVSDLLNMPRSFAHHWSSYGFWAEALFPYEEMGIFAWLDSPPNELLMDIVDPYRYLDRLTIPKFLIIAAGDDFFVSDSAQFYIHELPGETHLRVVPNTNHYLDEAEDSVFESLVPYYDAFLHETARPSFDWTVAADGTLTVETATPPKAVTLWQVSNPYERDFRLATTGANWSSSPLPAQGDGVYVGHVPIPVAGWTAHFIELVFDGRELGGIAFDYTFSTEVVVLPQERPFEADFNRDHATDLRDLMVLCQNWLTNNSYRDIWPRRQGDAAVNFMDFALLGMHWGQ